MKFVMINGERINLSHVTKYEVEEQDKGVLVIKKIVMRCVSGYVYVYPYEQELIQMLDAEVGLG